MSGARAQIAQLLDATTVVSPRAYVWVGQRFDLPPGPAPAEALRRELEARLYADFYLPGGVTPGGGAEVRPSGPWPSAAARALSRANAGSGSRQEGWIVRGTGPEIVVERDGLRVWADPDAVHPVVGGTGVGERVAVTVPAESFGPPHGFYTAYGEAGPGEGPLDRLYWNVRPEGRPALVAAVTSLLNRARRPFRLKVLSRPDVHRCDAGVLYTPARDRGEVAELAARVLDRIRAHLGAATPALTLALAPGLGFAEDPPGDESFGTHRCRLLAGAIAGARGRPLEAVAERFRAKGLSLDAPHRNPGSPPGRDPAWPA